MDKEKVEALKRKIDQALDGGAEPIAAFDADGTLWDFDMGENFFDYQVKHQCVPLPENAWDYYYEMKAKDPRKAYLWLAQINKGIELSQVHFWARESIKEYGPTPIFDHQADIISHMLERHVDVYIVTASIKWAIDPAAALFALPEKNVIGVTTKVVDGKITEEQGSPITYREGKVDALLEATGGKKPFFSSGNSPGDLFLLEAATHIQFVNSATLPSNKIHDTELEMLALAKERGWEYFRQD